MRTVNELAKITGVSRRAIRYYDQIGLLKPTKISESGYRLYDDKALEVLQQILLFKEMDVPLKDIKLMLNNFKLDRTDFLLKHKKILISKRNHLNDILVLIEKMIKEPKMMILSEVNISIVERTIENNLEALKEMDKEAYECILKANDGDSGKFVEKVIKIIREKPELITAIYGSLKQYNECLKAVPETVEMHSKLEKEMQNMLNKLSTMRNKPVNSPEVQNLISEIDNLQRKSSGIDFEKMAENNQVFEKSIANDPDKLKECTETREQAEKSLNKVYGQGFYKFYAESVEYYIAHKK